MIDPVMNVSDVTVRFGAVLALDAVSISVPAGQVVGVIGPNGAGKTTLFNVICGFVRPQAGTVTWQGRMITQRRPHHMAGLGIARTFQGLGLFPELSVLENVLVGATTRARTGLVSALFALPRADRDAAELKDQAMEHLETLGIAGLAGRIASEVDYGSRKRVVLARALMSRPELLLLDEPVAGLSDEESRDLARLLPDLAASVLLVEHHMDFVMSVCQDVIVMDSGKAVTHGTPDEIRSDPAVIAAYLGKGTDTGA
ncbi:ABC transporter ATP-binding protein [Streptomyces sp. NPDC005529]|uniref:ABC transporter ATP-binding protein n=1 Tax=unclassified Streptomyces TaxID=2593676 RepID=UPI0033B51CB0